MEFNTVERMRCGKTAKSSRVMVRNDISPVIRIYYCKDRGVFGSDSTVMSLVLIEFEATLDKIDNKKIFKKPFLTQSTQIERQTTPIQAK